MSDDNLTNVEDDAVPAAAVAETPPAETPPADPADPPADKPAEVEAVEVAGQKYVPLSVVQMERGKRQQLEPLARRAQELEGYVQANAPYIEFLKANPDFLKQRPADPVPPPAAVVDQDAIEYAKDFDLYDGQGNPDTVRARRIMDRTAKLAADQARQLVKPFEDQQLQSQAAQGYQFLRGLKHSDGTPINPQVVEFIWQRASAEPGGLKTLANKDSVASLALMALGADAQWRGMQPKGPAAPAAPPPFTEGSGGHPRSAPSMSKLEERVAKERGVTAAAWNKNLENFQPGRTNVLED